MRAVVQSDALASPATHAHFRSLVRELVAECNLPPLSLVAKRAMALTREADTTVPDLARVVGSDAALAARVLRIAGSTPYLRHTPPRTLQEAIQTVGFRRVDQILVAAAARALFPAKDPVAETLWAHALATALGADELRPPGEPRGGPSFLTGLFHDIGRLVFHLADPGAYAGLGDDDEAAERRHYGATHAIIGAYLVDVWGLGDWFFDVIIEHHMRPAYGRGACLAQADWIAHEIGCGAGFGAVPLPDTVDAPSVDVPAVAARVADIFAAERDSFA